MNRSVRWIGIAATLALLAPAVASAQERYTVRGDHVAVYNLAGGVEVVGGSGDAVVVEVRRGGSDAGDLGVEVGDIHGQQALRVIYPTDRLHYDAAGWSGTTSVRVRDDGTFGGSGNWLDRGDRVRISSRGNGMDAHADLRVSVPAGQRIDIRLAVGHITASNLDGRILLDTNAGPVEARTVSGALVIDTGSGRVDVDGVKGDLRVDTGSGTVRLSSVEGDAVEIDTGSGGVDGQGVVARRLSVDTGSGSIELRRSASPDVMLDTGSGSVAVELASDVDRLVVDTGSGSVSLWLPEDVGAELDIETGSGGIDVEFPVMVTHRERDELRGAIGDGDGTIRVDTGSGGVRIRRMGSASPRN